MKCYEISGSSVLTGIPVAGAEANSKDPYPRVILGEGGHKRATWIAIGKRDADRIITGRVAPCPNRGQRINDPTPSGLCPKCGHAGIPKRENDQQWVSGPEGGFGELKNVEVDVLRHPDCGEVATGVFAIEDAGAIKLPPKDGKPEAFLIVAPRAGNDNRVMVLWRVASGYRGSASIKASEGVIVIGSDVAWASGRGAIGETAEMLAILAPGQELRASRSGRRTQDTDGKLTWDGRNLHVTFGGSELEAAMAEEVQGEYL